VLAGPVPKCRPFGRLRAATVTDVHRVLASLALGAVAIHGTSLLVDSKVSFGFRELVVPGVGPYRPFLTGVGIVAAEVIVIVYVSFSARRWIGVRTWRLLHWLTYGIFCAVTVHGVMSGTDSEQGWATALYVGAVGAVVAATCWRALVPPVPARRKAPRAP
jgi:DMSO/TMAO reductase YedYZ heme-binding membrane subunit